MSTTRNKFARSLLGTAAIGVVADATAPPSTGSNSSASRRRWRRSTIRPPSRVTSRCRCRCRRRSRPSYNPNSLWRNGSRAFFNDQRAHQVGDILTVKVNINDTAVFADQTQLTRTSTEDTEISNFIGANTIKGAAQAVLPGSVLTASGNSQMNGQGTINRSDQLVTNIAAVVTQLLPNGNMVIEGKQEIRLNNEVRELIVAGVVRPEDIESDNAIELPKDRRSAARLWRARHTPPNIQTGALGSTGGGYHLAVLTESLDVDFQDG